MLSDEDYNNQLNDTQRALTDWAGRNETAAAISINPDASYWRVSCEPFQSSLCPIELILRNDRHYDLSIAGAAIEDVAIEDFSLFPALFEAVAEGDANVRTYRTSATHQLLLTTTTVYLADHQNWVVSRHASLGERLGIEEALIETRSFARYMPAGQTEQ